MTCNVIIKKNKRPSKKIVSRKVLLYKSGGKYSHVENDERIYLHHASLIILQKLMTKKKTFKYMKVAFKGTKETK